MVCGSRQIPSRRSNRGTLDLLADCLRGRCCGDAVGKRASRGIRLHLARHAICHAACGASGCPFGWTRGEATTLDMALDGSGLVLFGHVSGLLSRPEGSEPAGTLGVFDRVLAFLAGGDSGGTTTSPRWPLMDRFDLDRSCLFRVLLDGWRLFHLEGIAALNARSVDLLQQPQPSVMMWRAKDRTESSEARPQTIGPWSGGTRQGPDMRRAV